MEASPLLSDHGLTAELGVVAAFDEGGVVALNGDFATGSRRRTGTPLVRGRFATGVAAGWVSGQLGTVATGMSSVSGRVPVCGEFATGTETRVTDPLDQQRKDVRG